MSTRGQFNTKNPTIKRILKEASELSLSPSPDYHAEPLEENLFEWHFTICGPPAPSAYTGGIYHGRIILPPQYPLRPPSFRFLTPTGRFEVNREICLSISGHHEETWQPAWGVRTALVAIRSFMDTGANGQLGGIECTRDARERMARDSVKWQCPTCAKTNADIIKEREDAAKDMEGDQTEDQVPEELRLAYRDELGDKVNRETSANDQGKVAAVAAAAAAAAAPTPGTSTPVTVPRQSALTSTPPSTCPPLPVNRPIPPPVVHDPAMIWINIAIGVVAALLLYFVLR